MVLNLRYYNLLDVCFRYNFYHKIFLSLLHKDCFTSLLYNVNSCFGSSKVIFGSSISKFFSNFGCNLIFIKKYFSNVSHTDLGFYKKPKVCYYFRSKK